MLNSKFFTRNRKRLQESLNGGIAIVVFANGLMQRSRDSEYPFEQDRNFFYLTGVDLPEWILVIDEGKEYLISPERTKQQEIFDGQHNTEKVKEVSGVQEVVSFKTGFARLNKHKEIGANVDYKNKPFGIYSNPFPIDYLISHKIKSNDITNEILKLRAIKSSEELQEIKKAVEITKKGFIAGRSELTDAESEAGIQAVFDEVFTREYSEHAYNPIVASGKNACTLHYISNRSALSGQGLVLIDIGARSNYYAADVTRTWALNNTTERQEKVVKEVKKAFDSIIKYIKPGIHFKDYQQHVDEVMAESLRALGLEYDDEGLKKYFPHAPTHGLGLDVHDPIVGYDAFVPGMVITLEPGIYIPEEGVGARYEDDLLITREGVNNLSKEIR